MKVKVLRFKNELEAVENPRVIREYTEDALGLKRDILWRQEYTCTHAISFLYGLPVSHLESVDAWIHEFSETAVREQITKVTDGLEFRTVKLSFDGATEQRYIAHVLVALHCISGFNGKIVSPEEFEQVLGLRHA